MGGGHNTVGAVAARGQCCRGAGLASGAEPWSVQRQTLATQNGERSRGGHVLASVERTR